MFSLAKAQGFLREIVKILEKLAKANLWNASDTGWEALTWFGQIYNHQRLFSNREMSEHDKLCFKEAESSFQAGKIINITVYEGKSAVSVNRNGKRFQEWSWGRLSRIWQCCGDQRWRRIRKPLCASIYWFLLAGKLLSSIFTNVYSCLLSCLMWKKQYRNSKGDHSLCPNWKRDLEENPGQPSIPFGEKSEMIECCI